MARRGGMRIDTSQVQRNLTTWGKGAVDIAKKGMILKAANDENRAKANRPWRDRTGQARASITGTTDTAGPTIRNALAIGADHGKYLELANGGNYRVVWPTVLENQRELLEIGRIAMQNSRI